MIMVVAPLLAGHLPEREIIRDAVAGQIVSDDYSITILGNYAIRLRPKNVSTLLEIRNLPSFIIEFDAAEIVVRTIRATGIRIILTVDYADPFLFDKLSSVLASLGICLLV